MNIEFLQAKDGEITAKFNSLFLHSSYSPENESKRFVDNISIPFTPECIIICEPCISYIVPYLKEKFPSVKIGAVRFINDFSKYNSEFDFVFNSLQTLDDDILNTLSEETICSTYFINWTPSTKAFPKETELCWNKIKNAAEKAKTYLITRAYFEKKWFLNCCKNISQINNYYILSKQINLPVFIIASGPSLKSKINFIKENQKKAFIICLSSAISCLLKNSIIPDLCFSTDGGFWAGEHLKKLTKKDIPLALSSEGLCSSKILKNNKIILLNYCDSLSNDLVLKSKIPSMNAVRNGTVSGTALDFALENSNSEIYFFGLDMCNGKGFSHTSPNENEINNSLKDNRLKTKEHRISVGNMNSSSLNIYKDWFTNKNLKNRKVFRIINTNEKFNSLGQIKDLKLEEIVSKFNELKEKMNKFDLYFCKTDFVNTTNMKSYISQLLSKDMTLKQLFPLDYVTISHNTIDNKVIQERIKDKKDKILLKVRKLYK